MVSRSHLPAAVTGLVGSLLLLVAAGCPYPQSAQPLGTISDPIWQAQEFNAEKSDFVVHEHEFAVDSEFLNTAGEDHLKQIAARLASGQDALVLVERSKTAARPETEYKYRVHPSSDLDLRRRDMVVRCLVAMRIMDAEQRVVIAPDLAPQYRAGETAATYYDNGGHQGWGGGWGGGYGGGGGGWGGGYGGWAGGPAPGYGNYAGSETPSAPSAPAYVGSRPESGPR